MDIVLVGHIVDIVLVGLAVHTMLCFMGLFTFFPDMTQQSCIFEQEFVPNKAVNIQRVL